MRHLIFLFLALSLPAQAAKPVATCDDSGKIYPVCRDQKQLLAEAMAGSQKEHKQLVVVLGADWCPWCRTLEALLKSPEFQAETKGAFQVAGVGLYKERDKLPSGQAALEELKKLAGIKDKFKGIPLLAVVDPVTKRARFIDTEPLEKNTKEHKGHDPQKVFAAIHQAGAALK